MALTSISDLFIPAIWLAGMAEAKAKYPSIVNSGAVINVPQLQTLAEGAGVAGTVPTWKDITDGDEAIQVEDQAPVIDAITTVQQVVPILNRVKAFGVTALASQVSVGNSADVVTQIVLQLAISRSKREEKVALALLRAAFAGLGASGATAALSAVRKDSFVEATGSQTSAHLISTALFLDTVALLNESMDRLRYGALWMHPQIRINLSKIDAASFKSGVESGLGYEIDTYRGIPVFTSSALVRAGTTSGFVYETYLLSPAVIGRGEKGQSNRIGDVASFVLDGDGAKNNQFLYDRRRLCVHLNGMKWVGTPAGQSATNAELGTAASWELALTSADRVGVALLRTNG